MKRMQKFNKMYAEGFHDEKEYYEQEYADNKEIIDFIEKNIIEKNKASLKSDAENKPKKVFQSSSDEKDKSNKKKDEDKKETSKKHSSRKKDKSLKKSEEKDDNFILKDKCILNCNAGVRDLLNELGDEKIDLYVKNDTSGIFKQISVVRSDRELAKFNSKDSDIVVPLKNIVGIYCSKLSSVEKSLEKDKSRTKCSFEKSMRDYFNSLKGKVIELCTKGEENFKYLKEKTITNVGRGFIIVNDNTMVTFCNILFVKELKKLPATQGQKTDNKGVPKI